MAFVLIGYIVLLAGWNLLYKINKRTPLQTMYAVFFWGTVLALIVFGINFIFTDNPFANFTWTILGWMVLRGAMGVLFLYCWIQAMKYIHISIADPIFMARMFPLMAIGWWAFGDIVSLIALILSIVIFAVCLVLGLVQYKFETKCSENPENTSKCYFRGMLWLGFSICMSLPSAFLARYVGGQDVDLIVFVTIKAVIGFIIANLLHLALRRNPYKTLREVWKDKTLFAASIPDNFWALLYIPLALTMNIGLLDAILVSATILTILGGVILLKERIPRRAYALMAIALGCAVAIGILSM